MTQQRGACGSEAITTPDPDRRSSPSSSARSWTIDARTRASTSRSDGRRDRRGARDRGHGHQRDGQGAIRSSSGLPALALEHPVQRPADRFPRMSAAPLLVALRVGQDAVDVPAPAAPRGSSSGTGSSGGGAGAGLDLGRQVLGQDDRVPPIGHRALDDVLSSRTLPGQSCSSRAQRLARDAAAARPRAVSRTWRGSARRAAGCPRRARAAAAA